MTKVPSTPNAERPVANTIDNAKIRSSIEARDSKKARILCPTNIENPVPPTASIANRKIREGDFTIVGD